MNVGDAITATLQGNFAQLDDGDRPDGGAPPSADGGFTVPTPPAPGTYTLSFAGPARTDCENSLSGQESSFAQLTPADVNFADGGVMLTVAGGNVALDGATMLQAFGASSVTLNPDPSGLYIGNFSSLTPFAGPLSTSAANAGLVLDPLDGAPNAIPGEAAVVFANSDFSGYCSVTFAITLSSP